MILSFKQAQPLWTVNPTYHEGLIIQASHIAGAGTHWRRIDSGVQEDLFWVIRARDNRQGAMALGEEPFSPLHLLVSRPSFRVTLQPPRSGPQESWSVYVNDDVRILMPEFDPAWTGEDLHF